MPDPLPDDREAASLLARLETFRRFAEQHGELRSADGRLLWLLSDGHPRTLREIADNLNLEQSTVNRQVNAAVKAGLLSRSPGSGRAGLFEATAEGKERFEVALGQHLELYDAALDALTDRPAFLAELARFVEAYGDAVRRAAWSTR